MKYLRLSGNPIRYLSSHSSLTHLKQLEILVMEDLPYFGEVDEFALAELPHLRRVSFEGCKNLSAFHANAFSSDYIALEQLNLKGCNLRTLNASSLFETIKEIELDGNPFNCDCEIKWISELKIETGARCNRPDELKDALISEIEEADELSCSKTSRFMRKLLNSVILVVLLVICALVILWFLQLLKPDSRRKRMTTKVGPESPYQRVTIEPNRAEYSTY